MGKEAKVTKLEVAEETRQEVPSEVELKFVNFVVPTKLANMAGYHNLVDKSHDSSAVKWRNHSLTLNLAEGFIRVGEDEIPFSNVTNWRRK